MQISKYRIFKTVFLSGLSFMLLLGGCSKKNESASGNYYFKFSVGNQSFNYTANSYATFSTSNDLFLAGIGGFENVNVGTKNVASVLIGSQNPITQSTYTGLVYPGTTGNTPTIFFSWINENGKTFSSLYEDNSTNTATITQLSSLSVKGTFSGKIYDVSASGTSSLNFSGEFYVKRVD